MKLWIPMVVVGLAVIVYVFFYTLTLSETQGGSSVGIANTVGLVGVLVALIAAVLIIRRATPPQ